MRELLTKAWVLARTPSGEADELIVLYTQEFGKVHARARSIRKITSKVSAHLQPLAMSQVRFVRRNTFIILDAMKESNPDTRLISAAQLLIDMANEWEPDPLLWSFVEKIHSKPLPAEEINKHMLALLGFDSRHASCTLCSSQPIAAFFKSRNDFVCKQCSSLLPPHAYYAV